MNEWVFASRSSYERDLKAIQSLVREKTDSNYRTEILQPQTGNDSMKYGYNGISIFICNEIRMLARHWTN